MKCKNQLQLNAWVNWIQTGYPTGSRVIGGATEDSDFDYITTRDGLAQAGRLIGVDTGMAEKCAGQFQEYGMDCASYKYRKEEHHPWTNLLVVEDEKSLEAWKHATVKTTALCPDIVRNKETRVYFFRAFRNLHYARAGLTDRIREIGGVPKQRQEP